MWRDRVDYYCLLKEMTWRDVHRDCLSQTPDRRLDSKVNMLMATPLLSLPNKRRTKQNQDFTGNYNVTALNIHRSSQGSPDWTCIVAGFTSGYMRIYLQVLSFFDVVILLEGTCISYFTVDGWD